MFKFKMIQTDNGYQIKDITTGRTLNLNKKEDVKQLTTLLNDWYLIINDKWKV